MVFSLLGMEASVEQDACRLLCQGLRCFVGGRPPGQMAPHPTWPTSSRCEAAGFCLLCHANNGENYGPFGAFVPLKKKNAWPLVADSPWTYSRFRSNILLHLITSHFLTTLSSSHSEHQLHTSVTFVTPANWLGPCSFLFSSVLCALDCDGNLTHTLTLREAGSCATRS